MGGIKGEARSLDNGSNIRAFSNVNSSQIYSQIMNLEDLRTVPTTPNLSRGP